jgi:hypothetical protein
MGRRRRDIEQAVETRPQEICLRRNPTIAPTS